MVDGDSIVIRSAGVTMNRDEWGDYCRRTNIEPERRIYTQIGKYTFNDCDVCMNPEVMSFCLGSKQYYHVTLKWCDCGNGLWSIGWDYQYGHGGGGCGCSFADNDDPKRAFHGYRSEREEKLACCDRVLGFISGEAQRDKNMARVMKMVADYRNGIERPRPIQLELF